MHQVWKIMRVRKCWDIEDSTGNSNQQGSVLIIIKKEDMIMPHEMAPKISEEPHFQRVW